MMGHRMRRFAPLLTAVLCGIWPTAAVAADALTLDDALREAHAANARLPVAALDVDIAREAVRETRAERWLKVALEGDLTIAPSSGYDTALTDGGVERIQVVGRQPLLDGGSRRAAIARAEARGHAASARYRIAERELALDVSGQFAECLEAREELDARREGLDRLRRYVTWLRSRQAAGQGIAADVLRANVRLASEEADLVETERRLESARLALNDLLGRDAASPLELAALPIPEDFALSSATTWQGAAEVAQAEAGTHAAAAELEIARAERKPQLSLSADFGLLGADTTHLIPPELRASDPEANFSDRLKRDVGYSFSLNLSLPLWDRGALRARVAQAALGHRQAQGEETVQRRRAQLMWQQARAARVSAYRQIEILRGAIPDARDSYLEAESRHRGGAASFLDVLEAHAASVDAAVRLAEAVLRYRVARTLELRWGTP
jgi:outer membrane protein TolC